MGGRFKGIALATLDEKGIVIKEDDPAAIEIEPTDLLFVDTEHDAAVLFGLLEKHREQVRKYIVIHCTETFGQTGDQVDAEGKAKPGVMPAIQTFCAKHMEWGVVRNDTNNHGLVVLSRLEEDRKAVPSWLTQARNLAEATAKWVLRVPKVSLRVLEDRMAICRVCPERSFNRCSACGCPLEKKLPWATESCGLVKKGLEPKWGPVADPADLQ